MTGPKWRFGNRGGRAVLIVAVLGLLGLAATPALAQKADVSINTSRDQTTGCTEIKVKVVPKGGKGIQDVHLLVGETHHTQTGETTTYGDSMPRGYEKPVTPTGWNYNGPHNLDTVPGKPDDQDTWITWTSPNALGNAGDTFGITYCGDKGDFVKNPKRPNVILTSNGNVGWDPKKDVVPSSDIAWNKGGG
jgi:hypothetical protein